MGAVASIIFAARNTDKCIHQGETTRGATAICQSVSSLDAASKSSVFQTAAGKLGQALQSSDKLIEKALGSSTVDAVKSATGANSAIGAIAQKAVNPLLCVASGIRVLKDDDQYAALIEETSAMGAMFTTEACMKYVRSALTDSKQATTGLARVVAKHADKLDDALSFSKKAKELFIKIGKGKNGSAKQTLFKIGLDALFVIGSITAFNLGKSLGKKISGRDKEE